VSMRFGRSRVQDRARYSDVETVIDDPSAESEQSQELAPSPNDVLGDAAPPDIAPWYESAHFVDSHTITNAEGTHAEGADARDVDTDDTNDTGDAATDDDAIDALRAATSAADARPPELSPELAAEIFRLHEVTVDARRRAHRVLATPFARRRVHDAVTEESDALHMIGFATFDEFATAYAAIPAVDDNKNDDNAETIARIAEILAEIGIDPSADPLEAAREFLATHEDELLEPEAAPPVVSSLTTYWTEPPGPAPEPEVAETEVAETEIAETEEQAEAATAAIEEETVPTLLEAASAIEMAAQRAEDATAAPVEDATPESGMPEPEMPVPAAFHDAGAETAPDRDEEIVDRWISAEARAERMHAEYNRAQAELAALLARSAELESTVVDRVSERDDAHADLEAARARVAELEQSITRSDSERAEIEAALATGHDRIAELEIIAVDREQTYAESERDRAEARDAIVALEASLAERTSELKQARAAVDSLEAEITAHTADLDAARGELDTTRADALELRTELDTTRAEVRALRTELETTRRSVNALDEHAEAIEAELAEARRQAESPEHRQELEAIRQELTTARNEVGQLETRRTEAEAMLARDRAELDRLREELETTRELTANVRTELSAARNAFEATNANAEAAERAREAVTIDAAELLARAEAEAANLLERAVRDAEAIRQEARLENPDTRVDDDAITRLADQVDRLERKLTKQRRKLDEITHADGPARSGKKRDAKRSAVESVDENAAEILAAAEREATEIRRAARQDRDRFREELVGLLSRLADDQPHTD
jgi:chromosome segregation ATPase